MQSAEKYFPFVVGNWKSIVAIIASIMTGIALEKLVSSKREQNQFLSVKKSEGPWKGAAAAAAATTADAEIDEEINDVDDDPEENHLRVIYHHDRISVADSLNRSARFYDMLNQRRSVRSISSNPVPIEIIENIIRAGGEYILTFPQKRSL